MKKVKMFFENNRAIEKAINDWLMDNQKINIIDIRYSMTTLAGDSCVLIYYNEVSDKDFAWNSFVYHTICARATLYPGKTIDEVQEILNNLKNLYNF
jgi:hypothetical protein